MTTYTIQRGETRSIYLGQGEYCTVTPDASAQADVSVNSQTNADVFRGRINSAQTFGPYEFEATVITSAINGSCTLQDQLGVLIQDSTGVITNSSGAPAIPAFTSAIRSTSAAYSIANDATNGLTLTNPLQPWLWQDSQGHTQAMHVSTVKAIGFGVGSKVYALGTADKNFYVFDKTTGAWTKKTAGAIEATANVIHHQLFMDSRGYLFAAWAPSAAHAGGQKLYRSIDGGTTWTAVLTSTDMPLADDYAGSLTESDNGYLFESAYNSVATPSTKAVFRSTDGGATWTNIYANIALANDYARHIHMVAWDKYRNALWVTGGDGTNTKIVVSTDYGNTWTAWTNSWQATAIAFSPTSVVFCSDVSGYHDLYRATGTTVAQILAQTPTVVFKCGASRSPVSSINGLNGVEFAWRGLYNERGIFIFPYGRAGTGAALMVSSDDGVSWSDALGGTSSASSSFVTGGGTQWAFEPVRVSDYQTAFDGWYYALPNSGSYSTRRWRVYPANAQLRVNSVSGDDVSGDGYTVPFQSFLDYGIVPPAAYVLEANYTLPVNVASPGKVINRGLFSLGVSDGGGTLAVDENFEGTSTLTTTVTGSATVVQTSTTNPYLDPFAVGAGTRCARCSLVNLGEVAMVLKSNALTGVADGQEAWMAAWFYLTAASITTSPVLMQFQNGVNIQTQTTANGGGLIATTVFDSKQYNQSPANLIAVPLNSWWRLKVAVYKSTTNGRIRVWQETGDGPARVSRLVLDVKGVNTSNGGWTSARWGLNGGQASITADVDYCKLSIGFDPDLPGAISLRGPGCVILPDGIRS